MNNLPKLPPSFVLSAEVAQARQRDLPMVALESTVITHGLPRPLNLQLARDMEAEVRAQNAIPATVAVLAGKVHVGLTGEELEKLAVEPKTRKISRRDYAIAIARHEYGGTTVAGTLFAAHTAGLKVFATGGVGGIHRNAPFDVSADLPELSRTPIIVVCAGAKSILDLPSTVEYLETAGIPVVGYRTDEFPSFFSRSSGLPVNVTATTPEEIVEIAQAQWHLGMPSAILVVQPPPEDVAMDGDVIEKAIQQAVDDAHSQGISGSGTTPYLLSRVAELTGGSSVKANLALLLNNARLAAQIATRLPRASHLQSI